MAYRLGGLCPACGRQIEIEQIEVTSWSDPPGSERYIDGRASCPSGCDPRYRRFVVAPNMIVFRNICAENQWNPQRVIYVAGDDVRGEMTLRGVLVNPAMITMVGPISGRLRATIQMCIAMFRSTPPRPYPGVPTSSDEEPVRRTQAEIADEIIRANPPMGYIDRETIEDLLSPQREVEQDQLRVRFFMNHGDHIRYEIVTGRASRLGVAWDHDEAFEAREEVINSAQAEFRRPSPPEYGGLIGEHWGDAMISNPDSGEETFRL